MKTLIEVQTTDEKYPMVSLSKLVGQEIKDVRGYVTTEFGEPVFKVSRIVLADGRMFYVGGEHDIAYLEDLDDIIPAGQLEAMVQDCHWHYNEYVRLRVVALLKAQANSPTNSQG